MTRAEMDASSKEGAHRLAREIQAYWAKRGGYVKTYVEPVRINRGDDKTRSLFCVRTDMLNGLPRYWKKKEAA